MCDVWAKFATRFCESRSTIQGWPAQQRTGHVYYNNHHLCPFEEMIVTIMWPVVYWVGTRCTITHWHKHKHAHTQTASHTRIHTYHKIYTLHAVGLALCFAPLHTHTHLTSGLRKTEPRASVRKMLNRMHRSFLQKPKLECLETLACQNQTDRRLSLLMSFYLLRSHSKSAKPITPLFICTHLATSRLTNSTHTHKTKDG